MLVADLLNLVYPPLCLGCGAHTSPKLPLCFFCSQTLDQPMPGEVFEHLSQLGNSDGVCNAFALWIFDKDGPLQRTHRELKYGNRPYFGYVLGQLIGRRLPREFRRSGQTIVPVPLHRSRQIERGYNQSDMIADGVANIIGSPVDRSLLFRSRPTLSQTSLSIRARRDNLAGAFLAGAGAKDAGPILLIDDVITTGSTLSEAANVLRASGVEQIHVAALGFARV